MRGIVSYNRAGVLPRSLVGDKIRLSQVLVNLVKNALKFSHNRPIKIRASYDYHQKRLHVHVADKGNGIKEKDLHQLFKLFGKLDD